MSSAGVIGDHMALYLDIGTIRPDVVNDKFKYNVRGATDKERRKRGDEIEKDPAHSNPYKNIKNSTYKGNPDRLCGEIAKIHRNNFQES